jgi:membrane associated rhomboid family serine protease/Zn-finger nucleic acid-binding protein
MIVLLRKIVPAAIVNNLWRTAKSGKHMRHRACPACNNPMVEIPVAVPDGIQKLDVCTTCQFIWFDRGEYETLPNILKESHQVPLLSEDAKEKLGLWELEKLKERERNKIMTEGNAAEDWHWVPGIFGLPVEIDAKIISSKPIVTWSITALVTITSLIAFFDLSNSIQHYGLVSANWFRNGGLTFFTSFALHGGIIHLVSNMYFLFIFGDNVEDWLGSKQFLFLLLTAMVVGDIAHILGDPSSLAPCIGASGGISGVLAFYVFSNWVIKFSQQR